MEEKSLAQSILQLEIPELSTSCEQISSGFVSLFYICLLILYDTLQLFHLLAISSFTCDV